MRFVRLFAGLCFIALFSALLYAQNDVKKTDPPVATQWVENARFHSSSGKFSIAISTLPSQTIDKATQKAKDKGVDVGKQFLWIFERVFYTLYYNPPLNKDGDPHPQVYADMVIGSRKGALNGGATMISEKPIKFGKHQATELRYGLPNGVRFISRVILADDMGYQVVGGYRDAAGEAEVLRVLDSFTLSR